MSRRRAEAAKTSHAESAGAPSIEGPISVRPGDSDLPPALGKLLEPAVLTQVQTALMKKGLTRPSDAGSLSAFLARLAQETENYGVLKLPDGLIVENLRFKNTRLDALATKCAQAMASMLRGGFAENSQPVGQDVEDVLKQFIGNPKAVGVILRYLHYELREISNERDTLKRTYRKRAELPDPTKSADAEVNRPTVQVKLRIDPRIAAAIDEVVAGSGETRSDWLVDAAIERIKRERPDLLQTIEALLEPNSK